MQPAKSGVQGTTSTLAPVMSSNGSSSGGLRKGFLGGGSTDEAARSLSSTKTRIESRAKDSSHIHEASRLTTPIADSLPEHQSRFGGYSDLLYSKSIRPETESTSDNNSFQDRLDNSDEDSDFDEELRNLTRFKKELAAPEAVLWEPAAPEVVTDVELLCRKAVGE